MQRRHETTSFRTTIIVLGFTIASILIFIGLSRWLAPERDVPPPISVITFEAPPPADAPQFNFSPAPNSRARTTYPRVRRAVDVPEEIEEPFHDETYAMVTGLVIDVDTRTPLAGATVRAQWNRSPEEVDRFDKLRDTLEERELKQWDAEQLEVEPDPAEETTDVDEYGFDPELTMDEIFFAPNMEHSNTQTTRTDEEGRFTIYVPYERLHTLGFNAEEHIPFTLDNQFHTSGLSPPELLIELSVGATVSGRVYDLAGNMDIPDIMLNIHKVGGQSNFVYTDDKGEYTFSGLDTGTYEVRVEVRQSRYRPGKVLPFKKLSITQEREARTGVDFGLARAGVVWGYTRNPQTNEDLTAAVMLVSSDNIITQGINAAFNEMRDESSVLNLATRSEEEYGGYYELVGVPLDQEWRIHAMTSDTAPQLSDSFILSESSPDIRVDMNLFAGTSVTGRVIDENGDPVKGAEIACIPGFSEFFAPLSNAKAFRNDTSLEDGSFELDDLPNGAYQIFAFRQGYKFTTRGVPINSDGYNDIRGVTVQLHNVDLGEHIIYGTVTDTLGNTVPGARVGIFGFSLQAIFEDDGTLKQETYTDENGKYQFDGVALGTYFMEVEHDAYAATKETNVRLDEPTDVVLGIGAIIQGTVYAAETNRPFTESFEITGRPDTGVQQPLSANPLQFIELMTNQISRSFDEEANGAFQLTVPPGRYLIRAQSGTLSSDEQYIELADGDIVQGVQFFLGGAGGIIDGLVLSSNGENIQGARVQLTRTDAEILPGVDIGFGSQDSQTVGEDGYFAFENVPSGTYVASAIHPAYAAVKSEPIILEGNMQETVTLTLSGGGRIEGTVVLRGRPVPNATVMLLNSVSPKSTATDNNGYFEMDEVNAGEHTIVAISALSITVDLDNIGESLGDSVVVENGRTTSITLNLAEGVE